MGNVYSHPEAFGLEVVGEVDWGGSWEFSKAVVWRRLSDGILLFGEDSGCSCPEPFNSVGLDDLVEVDKWKLTDILMARNVDEIACGGPDMQMAVVVLLERLP